MKKIIIGIFKIYRSLPIGAHKYCRCIPTCSEYGIIAVTRFGTIKGLYLTIKRILKCNPFGISGYDPVIERVKK